MRTRIWPALLGGLLMGLGAGSATAAPDANQVRGWAATCATCHGTDGRAEPGTIALAGKNEQDMREKLLAYKNDAQPATVMHQISKGYSDEQLAALAAWFSAQDK